MITADALAHPLPPLIQDFFLERLIRQRQVSPCTVHSYRDTFRLLVAYVADTRHKTPTQLLLTDLDAPVVLAFLDHLETQRHNCIRTRNVRLAAIRSFIHFAAQHATMDLPVLSRVLAIPMKLCQHGTVDHLSTAEMTALLDSADRTTRSGMRDWILLQTLYNSGARVSELIAVKVGDVDLSGTPQLRIHGKGRKERAVPLWPQTRRAIRQWLSQRNLTPDQPLVPGRDGQPLTRSGVASRLRLMAAQALLRCPSLGRHRITPHLIRHTTATHLLQAGVDLAVIAMWLGHESIETTHQYMEADLELKQKALQSIEPTGRAQPRFRAGDRLLSFLEAL